MFRLCFIFRLKALNYNMDFNILGLDSSCGPADLKSTRQSIRHETGKLHGDRGVASKDGPFRDIYANPWPN